MKVYVVETGYVWQELRVEKVFSSREKAEAYKKDCEENNEYHFDKIAIAEFEIE